MHIPSDAPIFIVGAPRSGTTMLQYMLDDLPNITFPTGESHFIIPLYRNLNSFEHLDTHDGMRHLLQTMYDFNAIFLNSDLHGVKFDVGELTQAFLTEGRKDVRDVISGIFEKNAQGMGKSRWGDKTPYYALHLDKLVDWWPDAKIIHLIRDGRDVALSLFARQHDFSVYNIYHAAKYWEQYVETCRRQGQKLPAGQYLEIHYEDILEDKEEVMRKVCDFIGERYSEPALQPNAGEADITRQLKTVNKNNQGKWRKELGSLQVRIFESVAGESLRKFGYPVLTSSHRLPLPVRAAFRLHNKLASRLYKLFGSSRQKLNPTNFSSRT